MNERTWIIENLENAINTWNEKLAEIWRLITMSPQEFKDGAVWRVIVDIHGALQAVGTALIVLFFLVGVVKTAGSITELKRPEAAVKMFLRFLIVKGVITYGMELMLALFSIIQGVIATIMNTSGIASGDGITLPSELIDAINAVNFWNSIPLWAVTLIGGLFVTVLSFVMVLTVYGRFFRLYLYTAIAPIPLSSFAGEPSSNIGKSFVKGYAAVCLEGAIIILGCVIFSVFNSSPPVIPTDSTAVTMVWSYIGQLIFNMLILVGTVKMADRVVREMMGLH